MPIQIIVTWQLVNGAQLPIQFEATGCWLPVVSSSELTNLGTSCLLPVAYSLVVPVKISEIEFVFDCRLWQVPFHTNLPICIWLPFASCLVCCNGLKASQIEMTTDWLIFELTSDCLYAGCLITCFSLWLPQIDMAPDWQLQIQKRF